jgi:hypothetical protein
LALVWDDRDGDGEWDEGEPPLPGVLVTLYDSEDNSWTLETDAQGRALFEGLPPGEYVVRTPDLPGWRRTTARSVKLGLEGGVQGEASFGFQAEPLYLPLILSEV